MKTLGVGIVLMVALFFCLPYHLYMKQLWKKNPEKSWEKHASLYPASSGLN